MLADITLGQYYPGTSFVHKLDPRTKILATMSFIVAVFLAVSATSYVILVSFVLGVIFLAKLPVILVVKSIKPLWIIILLTMCIHLLTGREK